MTLVVINNDRAAAQQLTIGEATQRYTLDAENLGDGTVRLNGAERAIGEKAAAGLFVKPA